MGDASTSNRPGLDRCNSRRIAEERPRLTRFSICVSLIATTPSERETRHRKETTATLLRLEKMNNTESVSNHEAGTMTR